MRRMLSELEAVAPGQARELAFALLDLKRGGVIIAAVLSVAALVAILVGESWAVWPLIPLAAMEVVFLALWVRRRRQSNGPQRVR